LPKPGGQANEIAASSPGNRALRDRSQSSREASGVKRSERQRLTDSRPAGSPENWNKGIFSTAGLTASQLQKNSLIFQCRQTIILLSDCIQNNLAISTLIIQKSLLE
jgi:hypothetical protein